MKKYFLPLLCGWFLLSGCGGGSMGGGSPVASLSTTTMTFPGGEIEGTASQSMPITLTNSGNATLTISSIAASANFQEANTCGSTLASGANCTISVIFSPTTTGILTIASLTKRNAATDGCTLGEPSGSRFATIWLP